MKKAILLNSDDNVANVLEDVSSGDVVGFVRKGLAQNVVSSEDVHFGFKIAVNNIARGSVVLKYSSAIGTASENIRAGDKVHVHNLAGARGRGDEKR
jgi:altronate dehydratase small subunit